MRRAEPVVAWPTDGIPTVRPNLGVIFVPAMAGLGYQLPAHAMPWRENPGTQAIRAAKNIDATATETMRLAAEFYAVHRDSGRYDIAAYQADTQGVFDIAHLLNGDHTFYEVADEHEAGWIDELLGICHEIYTRATTHLKAHLDEPATSMIHGHGTSQGVYFPHVGTRMAEDTAIYCRPTPSTVSSCRPSAGLPRHLAGPLCISAETTSRCWKDCVKWTRCVRSTWGTRKCTTRPGCWNAARRPAPCYTAAWPLSPTNRGRLTSAGSAR